LHEKGFQDVKLVKHHEIGEVVPEHIEIIVEKETIAFIYRPISCHSYNTITVNDREVNVATIDTMLSLYLAFLYADKPYYDKTRILCMSAFLFQVEQRHRLDQRGILKRFSTKCYGKQESLEDIRMRKNAEFKRLSKNKKSIEYETAFLRYIPAENPGLRKERSSKISSSSHKKMHIPEIKPNSKPTDLDIEEMDNKVENEEDVEKDAEMSALQINTGYTDSSEAVSEPRRKQKDPVSRKTKKRSQQNKKEEN